MSDNPSTDDIMCGVKLGAVEVLEKPLSQTKLRTLWQHTVRKASQTVHCFGFQLLTLLSPVADDELVDLLAFSKQ